MVIIPIPIPKYVAQSVPDCGKDGCVGVGVPAYAIYVDVGPGVAVRPGVGAIVGVDVAVLHVQSASPVQFAFLQFPDTAPDAMLHIRSVGHSELFVQLLLHCGTCVGVGLGVGVRVGAGDAEGDGALVITGVGVGDGVGVEQTQSV